MINKLILYILLFVFSFNCLAAPYSRVYVSSTSGRSSGGGDGTILFLMVGSLAVYIYYRMAKEWIDRRKNKKKLVFQLPATIGEWVMGLVTFGCLSLFASLLIFVVLDFIGGRDLVRSLFFYVWAVFFVIVIFLAGT
jgi:hypothetical protein